MNTALYLPKYRRRFVRFTRDYEGLIRLFFFIILMIIGILLTNKQAHKETIARAETTKTMTKPIIKPTATPTPEILSDEEYIKSLPYGDLVWKTYGHESSYGANDSCKSQGMYNGFGYGIYKGSYMCFSSVRVIAKKVSDWFVSHANLGVNTMLCYYNLGDAGLKMNDCDYAEYTLSL